MLSGLRYFEHSLRDDGRGKPKPAFSWGAIDMVSVARSFINICNTAVDVLSNESRLVEVSSPCYVLGINILSLSLPPSLSLGMHELFISWADHVFHAGAMMDKHLFDI